MRDLAKDWEGIQANSPASYASGWPMEIVMEYLQRAIAAEKLLASHAPEGHNVTNLQYQELRAENAELKRKAFDAETRYQVATKMACELAAQNEKIIRVVEAAKNLDEALSRLPKSDKIEVTEGRIPFMVAAMALQKALWSLEGGSHD